MEGGAAAVLACLLALVPKTRPSALHMGPSGTVNRVGGGEWGWIGVQLGNRGLLGGAQLAARVLTARRHTHTHTHE